MISAILHLVLSLLTAIGALVSYEIWIRNKSQRQAMKDFVAFFIFFTVYHLLLSVPFFLFKADPVVMAWGYNFAVLFVFLILIPIYRTIIFYVMGMPRNKGNFLLGMLLLVGFAVVTLQIYYFRLPIIDPSGFIIWNSNLISGLITFSAVAFAVMLWVAIFLKNRPENLGHMEKFKTALYTLSFIMFTIASIYFIACNLAMVYTAFITVTLGTILMVIEFLIPKEEGEGKSPDSL